MKNILVTGVAGFIGSNLYKYLLNKNYKIIGVDDLSVGKLNSIDKKKIKFYRSKIENINELKILDKIDIVIHLAAKAEIVIPKSKESIYFDSNVRGLQSTLQFASKKNVKKFIFASSASVYGDTKNLKVKENFSLNPNHYYSYTKFLGEKMVKEYCAINRINFVIFRFFNVYGENSNAVVARFIAQYLQNKKITLYGSGKQKRDFIYVSDLNKAIFKSINNKNANNEIFNVGAGKPVSILYLKNLISKKNKIINLPKRSDDIEVSISDISKIKKKLKWKPEVNFNDGIKKMIEIDKKRLSHYKLLSPKQIKRIIIKFNNKI